MARQIHFDFADARVLVTGGSNGIGLAIATAYAAAGAKVAITGTAERKTQYGHDLNAFEYHTLDMRDGNAVDRIVQQAGELDVLVNCAGTVLGDREHTPDGFEEVIRVNLLGTQRLFGCA